jgi:hypothetical protein
MQSAIDQISIKFGNLQSELTRQASRIEQANHNSMLAIKIQKDTDKKTSEFRAGQANLTEIYNLLRLIAKHQNFHV